MTKHSIARTWHSVDHQFSEPDTQAGDEPTVTITMTADEAAAVLEALNDPCLQRRAFVGLTDRPFRQNLVEVCDALIEAGVVLPKAAD